MHAAWLLGGKWEQRNQVPGTARRAHNNQTGDGASWLDGGSGTHMQDRGTGSRHGEGIGLPVRVELPGHRVAEDEKT